MNFSRPYIHRSFPSGALAASIASLLAAAVCQEARAVDGTWIQNANPAGGSTNVWSDPNNWAGGQVADGIDEDAFFLYNPTRNDIGSNIFLDSSRTIGHIYFGDLDGVGSGSMAINGPTGGNSVLTLATTTGKPTFDANILLNNGFDGKKAILGLPATLSLAGTQGFDKTGFGFFSLRNNLAPLSGAIGIRGGTLDTRVVLNNNIAVTGAGILSLDFTNSGTVTSNLLTPSSTLALGGAEGSGYVTEGARAAVVSQTIAGLTINAGGNSIQANANSATNTFTWNLGTVTRNTGGALNLFGAQTFTFNVTPGGSIPGNDASGIIGGWLTFGNNDFARLNGSAVNATGVTYTNNTWGPNLNTTVNSVNFPTSAANTQTNATTHTLRFQDGSPRFLTLSGTNTIETGGVLFGNSGNSAHQINGGALTSSAGVSDLIVHQYSGAGGWGVLLNADVVDNGAPLTLVKAGTGPLIVDGAKSYTGGTILGQGTLVLGKALGGSSTGSVTGNIVNSGQIAFNRSGTYTLANTIAGNGTVAQWSEGTLVLNNTVSAGGLDLRNGTTRLDFSGTAPNNIVPAGVLTTTGEYTAGGRLILRDATLEVVGKPGSASEQTFRLTDVLGSAAITLAPGSVSTATAGLPVSSVMLNLGAINRPLNANDGGGTLKLTLPSASILRAGPTVIGATANTAVLPPETLVSDNGQAFVTVNRTDWGARDSTNTQIVAGSTIPGFYSSLTALNGNADYDGAISINSSTTLSSLRFNTTAAAAVTVEGGVQIKLGGILVTPTSGTPDISGSGAISAVNAGGRDLIIFQNSIAPMNIGATIANTSTVAADTTNLIKDGPGTLFLTGVNTYTGKTYVQGGSLRVASSNIGTGAAVAGNIFIREGTMMLEGTSVVNTGANFISIGQRLGETGTLTIQDSANWTTNGDFNVADVNSTGTLNLKGGAVLSVGNFYVGKVGSAIGTANFFDGPGDSGVVTIAGGATPADVRVGGNNPSDALAQGVIVQKGGTVSISRNVQIGAYGTGSYEQSGGLYAPITGFHVVGRFISGRGLWNLSGGTMDLTGSGVGGAFIVGEQGTGTFNVSGNAVFAGKSLSLGHNNGLGFVNQTGGTVSLNATGNVTFGTVFQGGILLGNAGRRLERHLHAWRRGAGHSGDQPRRG